MIYMVARGGIEPPTQGFSVPSHIFNYLIFNDLPVRPLLYLLHNALLCMPGPTKFPHVSCKKVQGWWTHNPLVVGSSPTGPTIFINELCLIRSASLNSSLTIP